MAENILKERIRSFGFAVVDDSQGKSRADFRIESEARFKKLSATLRASGITIEKFVLTSWTVKATDLNTGEEIYHSTEIPEKQSWTSEELALEDVGHLIGAKFSKSFFLDYFDFKPMPVRLRFSALPPALVNAVQAEIDANLLAISSAVKTRTGNDVVIDAQLSGGPDSLMTRRQAADPVLESQGGGGMFCRLGCRRAECRRTRRRGSGTQHSLRRRVRKPRVYRAARNRAGRRA